MKNFKIIITIVFFLSLVGNLNPKAYADEDLKTVSKLLDIIANNHDNRSLVSQAVSELEKQTPTTKEEVERLFELIGETKGPIQQKFIKAISNVTDSSFALIFIRELENENPMRVAAACGMSGKLNIKEAVPGLIAVIERYGAIEGDADTESERAVATAALALGEIRDERGLQVLGKYLGKLGVYDSQALAKFGAQALVILLKKIKEDHNSSAGRAALRAIGMITDSDAAFYLKPIIAQKDHHARKPAVKAMLNIDPTSTTSYLLELWEKSQDPFLEKQLLLHINKVRLKDPSLCPFLIYALKHSSNTNARKGAALALGRIGGAQAVEALKNVALNDADYFVRVYANQALKMAEESLEE